MKLSGEKFVIKQLAAVNGKVNVFERTSPKMEDYQVEIAPKYSYISAGTELNTIYATSQLDEKTVDPALLGYSLSGRVLGVGKLVQGIQPGNDVVAIGAGAYHSNRVFVSQNLVKVIPEGVDLREASLAAMFCFALEGVIKLNAKIGDKVVIFGAGMMGQIMSRLLEMMGCNVLLADTDSYRISLSAENIQKNNLSENGWDNLAEWAGPKGIQYAAIAFGGDASDVIEKLNPLMVRGPDSIPHGRIVFTGGAKISVLMASNMGNLQFLSSAKAGPGYRDADFEAGHEYPRAYVSHTVSDNLSNFIGLLLRKKLKLADLISHEFLFEEAIRAYALFSSGNKKVMGVILKYED